MKEENVNINENNPLLSGIPVEIESEEHWRKVTYTCTGSGRFEKNFDLKHLKFMINDTGDKYDIEN